jgi:colanic acid/amylovoran biosynthesis protein
LQRPLVLFAQSIGPFGTTAQRAAVGAVLRDASLIAVREETSRRHLADCAIDDRRVVTVPDAAFLWDPPCDPRPRRAPAAARRVGLCLRRWPRKDAEACRETIRKMRRLIRFLAARGLDEFVFVSTCQGVQGYIDDSDLAVRVVAGLEAPLAEQCVVHTGHHGPEDFMAVAATCDLFIGMRLHGCIMAMLTGTPALGLAYESKTPEIFGQLGLLACQVPFTALSSRWCYVAGRMIDDLEEWRQAVPSRMRALGQRARESLTHLDALVARAGSTAHV